MLKNFLITLFLTFSFSAFSQQFTIDSGHTAVTSKVQRFAMVDVVGRFNEVAGTIRFDKNDITLPLITLGLHS